MTEPTDVAEQPKPEYNMSVEMGNEQMTAVLLHPEVYKSMKLNRPMNFIEKLEAGRYWFWECFDEWCWQMTHDDGEFFNYLQSDYCKYEEDMYYEKVS